MPWFRRSELTAAIVRYLATLNKGEQVTYAELSKLLATPLDSKNSHAIYARRILERDHNAVWDAVRPNVGLYRLNDAEIAARQRSWYLRGASNKLRAAANQADVVELEHLSLDQQSRFATDSILRELARDALSKATQKRIEKVARGTSNDLPAFNAVEWMITLSPRRSGAAT